MLFLVAYSIYVGAYCIRPVRHRPNSRGFLYLPVCANKASTVSIKKNIRKPQPNMMITFFKTMRQLSMCLVNAINIITGIPNINPKRITTFIDSITLLYFYSEIFMVIANT